MDKDCEVCMKLIKEKHKSDFAWRIIAIIAIIISVIFAVLYFGSGAMITETEVVIDSSKIGNGNEDNVSICIGCENGGSTKATATTIDSAHLIIGAAIIIGSCIITGGIVIAYHYRKKD